MNINEYELTEDQGAAFEQLKEFCESDKSIFVLSGYAGTGKTFLMGRLLEWFDERFGRSNMLMAAPTHKALKVLRKSVPLKGIEFRTIHSALGMKEKISKTGRIYFQANPREPKVINDFSFVIVDEASMIGKEIFSELLANIRERNLKVIFVGDSKQIPPVSEGEAPPFDIKIRDEHGIHVATLTEIMRQKRGNPIINLTMRVRECMEKDFRSSERIVTESDLTGDGTHLEFLSSESTDSLAKVDGALVDLFDCKDFAADADHAKVIAWRNMTVDKYNQKIRSIIYGNVTEKITEGEKLICNSPIMSQDGKIVILNNNTELTVEEIDIKSHAGLMCYECVVSQEDGPERTIFIVAEESEPEYNKIVHQLKEEAKSSPAMTAAMKWRLYYSYIRKFADVKYNYAITGHKSQGSTYRNAIVMEWDINKNRKIVERNRIKYTAFTRASEKLMVVT